VGINKKGKRKVRYKGRQYLWYVQDVERRVPEEGGFVQHVKERWLRIIGTKKKFIIHYRIPERRDEYALLKIEGPRFPRAPEAKKIRAPRWRHDTKRYPTNDFVRRLIHWCMQEQT
jgi:hypothetical protein